MIKLFLLIKKEGEKKRVPCYIVCCGGNSVFCFKRIGNTCSENIEIINECIHLLMSDKCGLIPISLFYIVFVMTHGHKELEDGHVELEAAAESDSG